MVRTKRPSNRRYEPSSEKAPQPPKPCGEVVRVNAEETARREERRNLAPIASRMSLATRLRPMQCPRSRSSTCTRGLP
jgi:hypothetical protein